MNKLVIDLENVKKIVLNSLEFEDESDEEVIEAIFKEVEEPGFAERMEEQIALGTIQELVKNKDMEVRLKR